jgi:hypothetical protein
MIVRARDFVVIVMQVIVVNDQALDRPSVPAAFVVKLC